MPRLARLPPRDTARNGNVSQVARGSRLVARKAQDIRRPIDSPELAIKALNLGVADERDIDEPFGAGRRDAFQPARQAGCRHTAPAGITHQDAQCGSRSKTLRTL